MKDLPLWVWDLIIALERGEAVHGTLFTFREGQGYTKSEWCPGTALAGVPEDIRQQAQAIMSYNDRKDAGQS